MAAPDIQNLFERFLQIYGGQSSPAEPPRSEPHYQPSQPAYSAPADAYGSDDVYVPSGGVLRGSNSLPQGAPLWARALAGPGGRVGRGPPIFPMPSGRDDDVKIPDPHLEKLVPQWMRDYWTAQSTISRMLVDHLDRQSEDPGVPTPFPKPEDRSGGLGWYVGPPQLEEEFERSTRPSDVRKLTTIYNNDAAKKKDVAAPPLAPENPADTEGCDEEWAEARRECEKGMRLPPGNGPRSTPLGRRGRNYSIEDCASNLVRAICGGTPRRDGPSGEDAAKRNNKTVRRIRRGGK